MRQLVWSRRWIKWHVLTLGAMVTCGLLAAWQWQRAGSAFGSALNIGYGLQWPVFAVFFGVMWWRMLRMEAARLAEGAGDTEGPRPEHPAVAAPAPPRPAAEQHAVRAAGDPGRDGSRGQSPFGPRPGATPPVTDENDPELAAYNRMLAELAARHPDD